MDGRKFEILKENEVGSDGRRASDLRYPTGASAAVVQCECCQFLGMSKISMRAESIGLSPTGFSPNKMESIVARR
jgi:hypothetical protein